MLNPIFPQSESISALAQPVLCADDLAAQTQVASTQAELILRESQQFLQTVIETFPVAVFWKDRESRFLGCNQNFAQDANLGSPAEIIGKTDYDLPWGTFEADKYRADDRETIESGVPKLSIIETQRQADGTSIWVETNKIPLRNVHGETIGILGTYQDITERKQAETQLKQLVEKESVLRDITHKIRQSLDLSIVFETAVTEIRQFMETDRVGIFKFRSDLNFDDGEFVAESVGTEFAPILGVKIHDPYFGEKLARYYQKGRINVVQDIHQAGLLDGEIQVLADFQVQANLVIPLFDGPKLWGLLCIHHCARHRSWQDSEINFIEQIAEQIGIGIQQASLYEKVQLELEIRWRTEEAIAHQLRQQQTVGAIAEQIRNSLTLAEILATGTKQVKELMMVDRATVIRLLPDGKIWAIEETVSPEYPQMLGMSWDDDEFSKEAFQFYLNGKPRTVFDVRQDSWSSGWQNELKMVKVKSKIVAPILLPFGHGETPRWVSPSGDIQLWGLLIVDSCSSHRHWLDAEAQLLQQIADQLAIAIQQASLFEQLQAELTERKQIEIQLRQSNQELARATRLKDEFLASMSHELRTPLNAILGMSEALQTSAFGAINDRQQSSISTIEKSGKHLLVLIDDILDLSKIEANKFQLELTDVSIQSLCQNSLLFIKQLALKRQIRVNTQIPDYLKPLNMRVDDLRCRQVLINLLSNAVKFTPEGGSITLDVRVVDGTQGGAEGAIPLVSRMDDRTLTDRQLSVATSWRIVFSIVDTGIGIAPENMDKLFQSFVQIDSSLSRQYAGTGLGLALVKRIVEMHGGSVCAQSEVNRGSCFAVSLPFYPSAAIVVPPSSSPLVYPLTADTDETPTLSLKALILVVEDNEANMETMTGYLKSRRYRLLEAVNGQQAIDLAQKHCPDIILMDIQMPGMDGFEATRRIRQIPDCAEIPIVALTALAMPADRQKCLDAGANQYVSKPVKLGQLVLTIETLLS
jgi:PAS domain S-box-containing protein